MHTHSIFNKPRLWPLHQVYIHALRLETHPMCPLCCSVRLLGAVSKAMQVRFLFFHFLTIHLLANPIDVKLQKTNVLLILPHCQIFTFPSTQNLLLPCEYDETRILLQTFSKQGMGFSALQTGWWQSGCIISSSLQESEEPAIALVGPHFKAKGVRLTVNIRDMFGKCSLWETRWQHYPWVWGLNCL